MLLPPGEYQIRNASAQQLYAGDPSGQLEVQPSSTVAAVLESNCFRVYVEVDNLDLNHYVMVVMRSGPPALFGHKDGDITLETEPAIWVVEAVNESNKYRIGVPNEGRYWTLPSMPIPSPKTPITLQGRQDKATQHWEFVKVPE